MNCLGDRTRPSVPPGAARAWQEARPRALLLSGLGAVLTVARLLEASPAGLGTHRQLGLPPCVFHHVTGVPCPMCGATTAFAHAMHGEWGRALACHPVGAVACAACVALTLWLLACTVVRSMPDPVPPLARAARGKYWLPGLTLALMVQWAVRVWG